MEGPSQPGTRTTGEEITTMDTLIVTMRDANGHTIHLIWSDTLGEWVQAVVGLYGAHA